MISVVIPAHNEALVIGALLDRLDPGVESGDLEVVVVANGCDDETVAVARSHRVAVVELPLGSKPAALRAGDEVTTCFPRFYVDADISIGSDDLLAMARDLKGGVVAVAPRLDLDDSGASPAVRSYHRIWVALPSVARSLAGRGCYGLSQVGRGRWGEWPDVVADDGFVNQLFDDDEKRISSIIGSTVRLPTGLSCLISRKRRSHRGNVELESAGYAHVISSSAWLRVVWANPRRLVDVPVYLTVTLLVRLLTAIDRRRGATKWNSDHSSRGR